MGFGARALGLVLFAAPAGAAAAGHGSAAFELAWDAPPGCPTAADVEASIARLVPAERSGAATETLRVAARVAVEDGSFRATLVIDQNGARSERSVEAPTCALAADAAAVVVAMLLPEAPEAPSPAPPSPTPAVHDDAAPVPTDARPPAAPTERGDARPPRARSIWLGAAGFVDSATLPSAAAGAQVTATWRPQGLGLFGALGATPSTHATGRTTVDGRTLGADVGLFVASARATYTIGQRVGVGGGAGLDVGVLHARGTGAWSPTTSNAFWAAAAAGPSLRWTPRDGFALHVGVEALVPFARPTLVIDQDSIHRPAALAARATLGAEIGF